jgi:hypothetical protein
MNSSFYLGLLIGIILAIVPTHIWTVREMQREAIRAGVGEYMVNPETGKTEFRYSSGFSFRIGG